VAHLQDSHGEGEPPYPSDDAAYEEDDTTHCLKIMTLEASVDRRGHTKYGPAAFRPHRL